MGIKAVKFGGSSKSRPSGPVVKGAASVEQLLEAYERMYEASSVKGVPSPEALGKMAITLPKPLLEVSLKKVRKQAESASGESKELLDQAVRVLSAATGEKAIEEVKSEVKSQVSKQRISDEEDFGPVPPQPAAKKKPGFTVSIPKMPPHRQKPVPKAPATEEKIDFLKENPQTFAELFKLLDKQGSVTGSGGSSYSAEKLKGYITEAIEEPSRENFNQITRSQGLRQVVKNLVAGVEFAAEEQKQKELKKVRFSVKEAPGITSLQDLRVKAGKILDYEHAMQLCSEMKELMKEEKARSTGVEEGRRYREGALVTLPEEGEAIVVGDIHSRLECLEHILKETNFIERANNGEKVQLVFLGDYIDRPPKGQDTDTLKVLGYVLELKKAFPENVTLLQGNHERDDLKGFSPHEFPFVAMGHYGNENGQKFNEAFNELFQELPLVARAPNGVLMVHGGAAQSVKSTSDLANPSPEALVELLWNDPAEEIEGWAPFNRGGKDIYTFGESAFTGFMRATSSRVLLRAHQQKFSPAFNGRLFTISSTSYKDRERGYVTFDLSRIIEGVHQLGLKEFTSA